MPSDVAPITALNQAGAPPFVTYEARALLDLAIGKFEELTGRALSPSQVEMYLLEVIAYMLTARGVEEQQAIENCFVAFAQGRFLDIHGADRNTPRLQAAPASTTLRFHRGAADGPSIVIAAGARVSDEGGLVQFATSSAAVLSEGQASVDVAARALQSGTIGNGFAPGVLTTQVDPTVGIASVENVTVTGGGAELESDERYRARLPLAFARLGDGVSRERYRADVLGWNARCLDVHIARPQPGHVRIYPLMDTGAPNAAEITSLQAVFDDSNTHQGDFIQVAVPIPDEFAVDLTLVLSSAEAAGAAEEAVQRVLDSWERVLGGAVAPSELTSAARAVTGVVDASVAGLSYRLVDGASWRRCTSLTVNVVV